jgi:hypothetical protein
MNVVNSEIVAIALWSLGDSSKVVWTYSFGFGRLGNPL